MAKWKHPVKRKNNQTIFCFAYPSDLENAYAFYCARYENISFDNFLKLGITEFMMKFNSMPETEPLYTIIKSRTINPNQFKDKDERKHWRQLKKINAIPDIYKSTEEITFELKKITKEKKI